MGKVLLKTEIKREPGLLYFCSTSADGCITVCSSVMARGGRKKGSGKTKKAAKPAKKAVLKKLISKKTKK
jgi:hypothetical protein